jgi:hypothetical protein
MCGYEFTLYLFPKNRIKIMQSWWVTLHNYKLSQLAETAYMEFM